MTGLRKSGYRVGTALALGLVAATMVAAPARAQVPPPAPPAAPTAKESALEERLRKLEEMNRQVLEQNAALSKRYDELSERVKSATPAAGAGDQPNAPKPGQGAADAATGRTPGGGDGASGGGVGNSTAGTLGRRGGGDVSGGAGGGGSEGKAGRGSSNENRPGEVLKHKGVIEFGDGLEIRSDDGEFKLQFHDLTQAEYRLFQQHDQSPLHSSFFIPRQRWYFTGQINNNVEYYTAINRGYGSLDLLDAFITFKYSKALRFRVGRMKTPYLYEYYQIAEGDLIAPERSLYAGNLAGNRQVGGMFLGQVAADRVDYAIGAFNGPRRSFEDTNDAKDLFLFLQARPFMPKKDVAAGDRGAEGTGGRTRPNQAVGAGNEGAPSQGLFDYFNVGGSFNEGVERGSLQPTSFFTANDQSSATTSATTVAALSPRFLAFNNNVVERGQRAQWSGNIAWFYKSAMLLAEYGGGYQNYARTTDRHSTAVPFQGYMVQGSYFLTGEHLTRRVNVVKPLRDLRVVNGRLTGTGALEVHSRFSSLNVGRDVFTAGFADPNNWTNEAYTIDTGFNYYLGYYTKIYFDWQHAVFGNAVVNKPGGFEKTSDLFWLRFQVYF